MANFTRFHNFSNLFPPKLLRMTQNGHFCMAKIKCTLIQGNFYERLPFYMDSCAPKPHGFLVFGLCSNSDDRLSNLSNESQAKCDKRPPKSSKNEMFIFMLHSTSDDQPNNQMPPPQKKKIRFF